MKKNYGFERGREMRYSAHKPMLKKSTWEKLLNLMSLIFNTETKILVNIVCYKLNLR